ncbi:hypothetical protein Pan97_51450 [Bremerella volcania]|uniref:Uncharacterized protein n=1 Tax=Bremerella volcania TaxID=2527984 RepID=A0A518CFR6_9BACT|nr:hypothetical protein Pan97_51450 [Bremerella volcania]
MGQLISAYGRTSCSLLFVTNFTRFEFARIGVNRTGNASKKRRCIGTMPAGALSRCERHGGRPTLAYESFLSMIYCHDWRCPWQTDRAALIHIYGTFLVACQQSNRRGASQHIQGNPYPVGNRRGDPTGGHRLDDRSQRAFLHHASAEHANQGETDAG